MGKSAAKRLQALVDQIPEDDVIWDALNIVEEAGPSFDYSIALIGAAYVEKALEIAILTSFVKLTPKEYNALFKYENRGPLSDLSSRIKIAYALDIIGPQSRDDLDHVRQVRNAFAHSPQPLDFDTQEVVAICDLFNTHPRLGILSRWALGNDARSRYVNTAITIARDLKKGLKGGILTYMHAGRAFPGRLLP
jgi:hypothetical protein